MKDKTLKIEDMFLSKYAFKSKNTLGREVFEEPCVMRTPFQRDRDRIIHCKSFRRLKNKTQVFFAPEGDHYRTRLTHTLTVAQISRSIARALSLNEDLAEAIALGHDLGHTPFGHSGERILNSLNPNGFRHNEQSLRVIDFLENDGKGLNLTFEVRDGILNHRLNDTPKTLEGAAVSIADRIAYINHDIDDAIMAGFISKDELPADAVKLLGDKQSKRINTMIMSIYRKSDQKNFVQMEDDVFKATNELRQFLFDRVYNAPTCRIEEEKALRMLTALYGYFKDKPQFLPEFYGKIAIKDGIDRAICDYLSGMSDFYALKIFGEIFIPSNWKH